MAPRVIIKCEEHGVLTQECRHGLQAFFIPCNRSCPKFISPSPPKANPCQTLHCKGDDGHVGGHLPGCPKAQPDDDYDWRGDVTHIRLDILNSPHSVRCRKSETSPPDEVNCSCWIVLDDEALSRLTAHLEALEARLKAAEEDGEMLDWLSDPEVKDNWSPAVIDSETGMWWLYGEETDIGPEPTLRQAIRQAMQADTTTPEATADE